MLRLQSLGQSKEALAVGFIVEQGGPARDHQLGLGMGGEDLGKGL